MLYIRKQILSFLPLIILFQYLSILIVAVIAEVIARVHHKLKNYGNIYSFLLLFYRIGCVHFLEHSCYQIPKFQLHIREWVPHMGRIVK